MFFVVDVGAWSRGRRRTRVGGGLRTRQRRQLSVAPSDRGLYARGAAAVVAVGGR